MPRPDPTVPFWGESAQVDAYAYNVSGTVLPFMPGFPEFGTVDHASAEALVFRGPLNDSAASATLTSGDAIQLQADAAFVDYMVRADSIVASWTLEVLSGTGTLHLSQVLGEEFRTGPIATPTDLGTINVTGPGTYTVTAPGVTADHLFDRVDGIEVGLPIVTIEATSGAVELQQVKMRLWPPGGPLGSLSGRETEEATSQPADVLRTPEGATDGVEEASLDYDAVWEDGWNAARAYGAANLYTDGDLASYDTLSILEALFVAEIWTADGITRCNVRLDRPSVWFKRPSQDGWAPFPSTGTDGVDFIRNPYEVNQDPVAYGIYDAPPVLTWESAVVESLSSLEGSPPPGQNDTVGYFYIAPGEWPEAQGPFELEFNTVGMGGPGGLAVPAWPTSDSLVPLSFPDSEVVRITAAHEYFYSGNPALHGQGVGSIFDPLTASGVAGGAITSTDGSPVKWHVEFSPFSYWVPGPARTILPLRQHPRDDGLKGGSTRTRGTSRQATISRTAYL